MSVTHTRRCAGIAPVVALLLGAQGAIAQQPATGGFIARAAVAPADRIQLSADQVKTILTARYPAIVSGTAEDNLVTIVVASNGDYVTSGSSKQTAAGGIVRASAGGSGTGGDGGFAATGGSGGSGGAVAASAGGASGSGGGTAPRAAGAVIVPRTDDGQPHYIKLVGIGDVDASLVKDMYFERFAAGELSVNELSVRIVTLKGTAMK